MNTVIWKQKATKQLRKLDRRFQSDIYDAVQTLKEMPNCSNVKALTSHQYDYRLRVGNYRVFFDWDGEVRIVDIEEVKKRDERTY